MTVVLVIFLPITNFDLQKNVFLLMILAQDEDQHLRLINTAFCLDFQEDVAQFPKAPEKVQACIKNCFFFIKSCVRDYLWKNYVDPHGNCSIIKYVFLQFEEGPNFFFFLIICLFQSIKWLRLVTTLSVNNHNHFLDTNIFLLEFPRVFLYSLSFSWEWKWRYNLFIILN